MTYFMPFSCGDERHVYEECEYNAYLQRVEVSLLRGKVTREGSKLPNIAIYNTLTPPTRCCR